MTEYADMTDEERAVVDERLRVIWNKWHGHIVRHPDNDNIGVVVAVTSDGWLAARTETGKRIYVDPERAV